MEAARRFEERERDTEKEREIKLISKKACSKLGKRNGIQKKKKLDAPFESDIY